MKHSKKEVAKLLDKAIEAAKQVWGERLVTRYQCPKYNYKNEVWCKDLTDVPSLHEAYCPEHGEKIQRVEVPASNQEWEEQVSEYIYGGVFPEE